MINLKLIDVNRQKKEKRKEIEKKSKEHRICFIKISVNAFLNATRDKAVL